MLLLLPPSESKTPGGDDGTALDPGLLRFPQLTGIRQQLVSAAGELAADIDAAAAALKVGPSLHDEVARNRELLTSPTMPAIDRFTGVLFDALDAGGLTPEQRQFVGRTVAIHSALFGLVGALDPIPAYRLSHDTRLPGIRLKATWKPALTEVLAQQEGLLLDLRSEAYAALGPIPQREDAVFVRVVADDGSGRRRALNHFNKKGKGEFVRAVVEAGVEHPDVASLIDWAAGAGFPMQLTDDGELELVVANTLAA